jgi:hypothetical protein
MSNTETQHDMDTLLKDELINAQLFDSLSLAYLLNREFQQQFMNLQPTDCLNKALNQSDLSL